MSVKEQLQGVTVVITGASSGFGKGIAIKLAEEGANVVLAARRTELIKALASSCGDQALAVTADVGKPEEVERLAGEAIDKFGRIDVWINNAGIGILGSYTDVPLADLTRVTETNLLGTMYGSHIALRHFKAKGAGTLINISSISGKIAFPFYSAYSATKFAVTGLTKGLHLEVKSEGYEHIHVCGVYPWATDTPWFDHTGNYSGHTARMQPLDRPEHVVDAVIDLIRNPQEEVEVGAYAKGTAVSSHLFPSFTDQMSGKLVLKMIHDAPETAPTSGSLYEPMAIGTEVSGGVQARIEAEDRRISQQH
ncbi:oxidoreductase [Paenibacillus swuensis]|uniref:Oxidoreductase n=1 Tax=Paenibacillus swuensis TaxID=1178515 RepID=A0A172TGW9_9BACL|nr:SDR family NAD(P)-dependent oxidoreductase [Paenibacillus swuensis]ANE46196.1 oxidoreductase [Paenibacillus swuensis]